MYIAPVLGSLAVASLVSAIPLEKRDYIGYGNRGGHMSGSPSNGYYTASAAASSWSPPAQTASYSAPPPAATGSGSNPFSFPLSNGFPNIQNPSSQLNDIEDQAHGTLPNGPPPPSAPAEDDLLSLRMIAYNELWEVAFFTELLYNITNEVEGYQFQDERLKKTVTDAVTAIQAQEELHLLNANGALAHFNAGPILPCQYVAPVSDFKSAISLAATFTDVVMGTLGDVQTHFAINGDNGLIRGVAAVIGQEGEQDGFFRNLGGLIPSQLPFLTASTREIAFNALNQNFIVPGSCPNVNTINLPTFGTLSLQTAGPIAPQDQSLQFAFEATGAQYGQYANNWQGLSIAFINQQNVPVVEPITGATVSSDGTVSFSANFPFTANKMFGLTIATIVKGDPSSFNSITDVVSATLFGPALIEVL